MAYRLDPLRPVRDEAVRVFREGLSKAVAKVGEKRTPAKERIHAARTTTKKLRALLALTCSPNPKRSRKLDRTIARAARRLGSWRDADAMQSTLEDLARVRPSEVPSPVWAEIRRALSPADDRSAEQKRTVEAELGRFARDLEQGERQLAPKTFSGKFETLAKNFSRTYRDARRGLHHAQARPCAESFHEWRKATKTFAYECRLLRDAWPDAMKALRRQFEELSGLLGAEHDLTVLRAQVRQFWAEKKLSIEDAAATSVLRLMTRRREELRAELLPQGERLFVDKPDAVHRRISVWWRVATRYPLRAAP